MLPGIITNIRNKIIEAGGEIHFNSRVADLLIESDRCTVSCFPIQRLWKPKRLFWPRVIRLAKSMNCYTKRAFLLKPSRLAVGVRAEHPQTLIEFDSIQSTVRGPYLPPATYFVCRTGGCEGLFVLHVPRSIIVPAATARAKWLSMACRRLNGNTRFANSGMVVEIRPEDLNEFRHLGVLRPGIQRNIERLCFSLNGNYSVCSHSANGRFCYRPFFSGFA